MEEYKYYLRLTEASYSLLVFEAGKEEDKPGDIEVTAVDYSGFMERLGANSTVQVKEIERRESEKGILGFLEIFEKDQRYFRAFDNQTFGFVIPDVFYIRPSDILVPDEEYWRYIEEETTGKNFRCKEPMPEIGGLFDMIEEYIPDIPDLPPSQTEVLKEQLQQQQLATAEAIEKQEKDKIEQQLAQAEMLETILQILEPQEGGE